MKFWRYFKEESLLDSSQKDIIDIIFSVKVLSIYYSKIGYVRDFRNVFCTISPENTQVIIVIAQDPEHFCRKSNKAEDYPDASTNDKFTARMKPCELWYITCQARL